MVKLIEIPKFLDNRGSLSGVEKLFRFKIKRVYFLYNFNKKSRGKHKHKKNKQFLICLFGQIKLKVISNSRVKFFNLSKPTNGILLEPNDWHEIIPKKKNSIVCVLASKFYDKNDYLNEV